MFLHAQSERSIMLLAFPFLLMAGCASGGGWKPAEPEAFQRLQVQSDGRWGSVKELRFGDYTADSVKISWAKGSGAGVRLGGIGTDGGKQRQEYQFSLQSANQAGLSVSCHSAAQERSVALKVLDVQASTRLTLECDFRPHASTSVWRMSLAGGGDRAFEGALLLDSTRLEVIGQAAGSRMLGRSVRTYELRAGGEIIAVVDLPGRVVWLARSAPADERQIAAAAAATALLLYQRPG